VTRSVVATAAVIVMAVAACGSGAAKPGIDRSAAPAAPIAVAGPFPDVNRPCQGKIPEPFAGVATNGDLARNVASFHRATGARVRVVEFYGRFPGNFQSADAEQVVDAGELPLIQLDPRHVGLAQVAAGAYDGGLRTYAEQVKAFGCYIILSFGHEMNGWWYPWGLPDTSPPAFKAAWRNIHDIFSAERVRNVIWSWDPTHQHAQRRPGETAYPASEWYPGNKYVDWIGIDGYLGRGQNFSQVFGYQLRDIRKMTRKPVYLAETGVGNGSHVIRQMASLFAGVRRWRLIGLVWFDLNRKNSWSLQGSPVKDAAFRRGVAQFG
jgi:mannan endo-1,4-beta-mannosidase